VIRDLVDQALRHFPSGRFNANAAWTVIALPRPQPAPLDRTVRAPRQPAAPSGNAAPPAAHPARPSHLHRAPLDAAPARPLALARRLPRRAHSHPRTPRARLTAARPRETTPAPPDPAAARTLTKHSTLNRPRRHRRSTTTQPRRPVDQHHRLRSPLSSGERCTQAQIAARARSAGWRRASS
jgi:hypothetical protein